VSISQEFQTGEFALIRKDDEIDPAKLTECVIISGPIGQSRFYKVGIAGGTTDHFAERELIHKPQQADRLTPVKWKDCAWIPEILR
jgi:hypothetical protein